MDTHLLKMIAAGIVFAIWPLLLAKSGLGGLAGSVALQIGCFAFLIGPLLHKGLPPLANVGWWMCIGACAFGAIGLYLFNGTMTEAPEARKGGLFQVMIVMQVVTAAIIQAVKDGKVSLPKVIGFAAAIVACVALTRKG